MPVSVVLNHFIFSLLPSLSLSPSLPPSSTTHSHPTGLPSLPLLLTLVNVFKADISAQDAGGLTPLCLAAKIGEETVAEVSGRQETRSTS